MKYLLLLFFLLLSACSFIPSKSVPEPDDPNWLAHKARIMEMTEWHVQGRFSAHNESENWAGHFQWLNETNNYVVNISAPMSGGSLIIRGDAEEARIILDEETSYSADDANYLLYTYTGLRLPINELKYWLKGVPAPEENISLIKLDSNGKLAKLAQQNWTIDFKRYRKQGEIEIPDKIFLENHEFDVRLSIRRWKFN